MLNKHILIPGINRSGYSFLVLLICFQIFFTYAGYAQQTQDTTLWRLEMKNGNVYIGSIISQNSEEVKFNSQSLGIITIKTRDLESLNEFSPKKGSGRYRDRQPLQSSRYFWAPNGYGLKKGEGYYQNVWVFFNQASVGITDNFSMGIGTVPLFLFEGTPSPVWITPKFSIPVEKNKFNLGGGALIGTVIGEENAGSAGIAYGVATIGDKNRNINFGLGYGFVDKEWANTPLLTIGGLYRLSKRGYLISENYYLNAGGFSGGVLSLGGRTVWDEISLDYGGFIPFPFEDLFVVPWLGLSIPFGN